MSHISPTSFFGLANTSGPDRGGDRGVAMEWVLEQSSCLFQASVVRVGGEEVWRE
jgi:hypothetical protein